MHVKLFIAALILGTAWLAQAQPSAGNRALTWSQSPGFALFTNSPNLHGGARPSSFDWRTVFTNRMTTNIVQPNTTIADDFVSDGRPVTTLRWWGSYLPGYTNGFEDAFVLSFFEAGTAVTPCAVGFASLPYTLLGTYVAPFANIRASSVGFAGWDSNAIYQYEVELADTWLVNAPTNLATPTAFLAQNNSPYFLAIDAGVGCTVTNQNGAWIVTDNNKPRPTNHFWGWQTSPLLACFAPPSGLVSWWPGDVNGQDIVGTNQAVLRNQASIGSGFVGSAFNLDGTDDYVNTGDLEDTYDPRTGSFTIDCWFRQTATSADCSPLRKGLTSQSTPQEAGYGLTCSGGSLSFTVAVGPTTPMRYVVSATTALPSLNTWHHAAGVLDRATQRVRLFLDGRLVQETSFDSRLGDIFNDRPLVIGAMSRAPDQFLSFFPGQIDEVQYFNRALGSNEILGIFNAGSIGQCKPGGPMNDCASGPCTAFFSGQGGWWPGDGHVQDIMGNSPGRLIGGATFASGYVGQGFRLDGVDDRVDIPDSPGLSFPNAISLDAWIRPNTITDETIISKYDTSVSQASWAFLVLNGKLRLTVFQNGITVFRAVDTVNPVITAGVFSHVAATFDPTTQTMKIYVTGTEVPTVLAAGSQTVTSIFDSTTPVRIGALVGQSGSAAEHFNGVVDEASIHNYVLAPSEIAAIYNAGAAGKCKPGGIIRIARAPSAHGNIRFAETNWVYPEEQWQANTPFHMELEQAFQLLTPCITVFCPGDFRVWSCSNSARVTFTVTVTNGCGSSAFFTCDPPSGSIFPVGVNSVLCRGFDFAGHSNTCSFNVTVVQDAAPPVLTCPSNFTASTTASGIALPYEVAATDDCDTNVQVVCTPPSGNWFPLGVTFVDCQARDDCGKTTTCSFCITVENPASTKYTKWSQPPGYLADTNRDGHGGARASDFDCAGLLPGRRAQAESMEFSPANNFAYELLNTNTYAAQTFRVDRSGFLGRVDVYVRRDSFAAGDWVIDIRPLSPIGTGIPSPNNGSAFASVTVPASVLSGTAPQWISVELGCYRLAVSQNQTLAIVLHTSGTDNAGQYAIGRGNNSDPYPRGNAFWRQGPTADFQHLSSPGVLRDFFFRTFINTNTPASVFDEPNAIIADDFRSDGRPIQCVRWWGAYLPGYTYGAENSFLLSFFTDAPRADGGRQPGDLLGTYLAPLSGVRAFSTGFRGWDGNTIYQYEVELANACLEQANTNYATSREFLEAPGNTYWLAISAEMGIRVASPTNQSSACVTEIVPQRATNHFWGWQTSPSNRISASTMGHITRPDANWLYTQWMPNAAYHMERDQAFDLLTPDSPDSCSSAPRLTIASLAQTNIMLTWSGFGYVLQATPALAEPSSQTVWTTIAGTPPVILPLTGGNRFFRLACGTSPPDFTLGARPLALVVRPGETGVVAVAITSINGLNSPVTLFCSGQPAGVACRIDPQCILPIPYATTNSLLSLEVAPNTAAGSSTIQISGSSAVGTRSIDVILTIPLLQFSGPADAPLNANIPDMPFPPVLDEDGFSNFEGVPVSRRLFLMIFQDATTVGQANQLLQAIRGIILGASPLTDMFLIQVPDDGLESALALLETLQADPRLEAVALEMISSTQQLPSHNVTPRIWEWDVPATPRGLANHGNWGLELVRAPQLWNLDTYVRRKEHFRIGALIVDDNFGFNLTAAGHPDLTGEIIGGPSPVPKTLGTNGDHGTFVAGIVGARWNNGIGVEGVSAWMGERDLDGDNATDSDIYGLRGGLVGDIDRILTAVKDFRSIKVINRSLGHHWDGGPNSTQTNLANGDGNIWFSALRRFVAKGGRNDFTIVVPAGNDGTNQGHANIVQLSNEGCNIGARGKDEYHRFHCVEAINSLNGAAFFTQRPGTVSAPGVIVRSTEANDGINNDQGESPVSQLYATGSGTSFAAPHVAGLIADLLRLDPNLTRLEIRSLLRDSDYTVETRGANAQGGTTKPRIDAFAAAMGIDLLRGTNILQRALVNVDDGSHYDGNARLDHDDEDDDEDWLEPYETVVGVLNNGIRHPDGRRGDLGLEADMLDFRVLRDAYVQLFLLGAGGTLDGADTHFKKDLNHDGCTGITPSDPLHPTVPYPAVGNCENAANENVFPRYDFNGSGRVDEQGAWVDPGPEGVAPFKVDPDQRCEVLGGFLGGCWRDIDILAQVWSVPGSLASYQENMSMLWDDPRPAQCPVNGRWHPMMNLLADRDGNGKIDYVFSADLHFILGPVPPAPGDPPDNYDRLTVTVTSGAWWVRCIGLPEPGISKYRRILTVPLFDDRLVMYTIEVEDTDDNMRVMPKIEITNVLQLRYGEDRTIRWPEVF